MSQCPRNTTSVYRGSRRYGTGILVGALVGGALSFVGGLVQQKLSRKKDEEDRKKDVQMDLVREIMRYRGSGDIGLA